MLNKRRFGIGNILYPYTKDINNYLNCHDNPNNLYSRELRHILIEDNVKNIIQL